MSRIFKKLLILPVWCLVAVVAAAQAPSGYYNFAEGLTGTPLQGALHDIIDNHTVKTYDYLWTAFKTTDMKSDGTVWDMYSDIPSGTPDYTFTFVTDQCGNYSGEGSCYNREHSFPKSWFDDESPMVTDLFHLYPTDGYVNGKRSNYPFGEVSSPTWTSSNGSKLGPCSVPGYSDIVFEPIDEYKGDFARTYFYMATRYYDQDSKWTGSGMVTGAQPKPWALAMLLAWNKADPVSQKETDRNNAVYAIQNNRNPFIDYPLYADMIWDPLSSTGEAEECSGRMTVYPNPATTVLNVIIPDYSEGEAVIQIYDAGGCLVKTQIYEEQEPKVEVSDLKPGMYLLQVTWGKKQFVSRFIVAK